MSTRVANDFSRRQFLISSGVAVAAACFTPPLLFAQKGLVEIALKESATAKVTVQVLRRNISVLLGPGGNIAVLTGQDGKLLVDAEVVTARPNVTAALAGINATGTKLPQILLGGMAVLPEQQNLWFATSIVDRQNHN